MLPIEIKKARIDRGVTQLELARLVGVQEQTISRIETGRLDPEEELVLKISRAFKALDTKKELENEN